MKNKNKIKSLVNDLDIKTTMCTLCALTSSSSFFYHVLCLWHHIMWPVMWLHCHVPLHHPLKKNKDKNKIRKKKKKENC